MTTIERLLAPNVCLHVICTARLFPTMLKTIEQAVASMVVGSEILEAFKCPFCETDHQVRVEKGEDRRTSVVLNIWRNYGRRHGPTAE
jgi:hypothetical protein